MGITKSPFATLVPHNPSPALGCPPPVPLVSAIQIPKNVPTNAPTAVKNWLPIACDLVKPDLIKME